MKPDFIPKTPSISDSSSRIIGVDIKIEEVSAENRSVSRGLLEVKINDHSVTLSSLSFSEKSNDKLPVIK
jgi:hypothetical protein